MPTFYYLTCLYYTGLWISVLHIGLLLATRGVQLIAKVIIIHLLIHLPYFIFHTWSPSHPMHLLVRSLTGVLQSIGYTRIWGTFWWDHSQVFCLVWKIIASETPSGEITHRCSAKFKVISHLRHLLVRSLTGVLLVSSHPRHLLVRSLTGVLLSLRLFPIWGTFWWDHSQVFCLV